MLRRPLIAVSTLSLFGCSGLAAPPDMAIRVDSVPVGASVIVMGEAMGQTPLTLYKHDLFPRHSEPGKSHLYGRIEITYPGCKPFVASVNSRIVREGLSARLQCDGDASPKDTPPLSPDKPVTGASNTNLKERLQQLKELFEEGLISEQEYSAKRQQLLQQL